MIHGKNRFVFVAPMYNASETLPQMLHSIFGQSYTNWKIILIDDVSNPDHLKTSEHIVKEFVYLGSHGTYAARHYDIVNEDDRVMVADRLTFVKNATKKWETANVLHGISMCEDDDIVCRIDADDWLTDLDALAMIDATYQQTGCDALWTAHRWAFSDKNISGPMPDGADPYKYPWVSSHLKSFRKSLLNGVPDVNFRNQNGEYVRRCGDQAMFLPVLHRAKKRFFLNRCLYHYTIKDEPATYQTPDAIFQRDEALFLRERGYVE